jgi:hypothetical protein
LLLLLLLLLSSELNRVEVAAQQQPQPLVHPACDLCCSHAVLHQPHP